jgi:hypothetical protein
MVAAIKVRGSNVAPSFLFVIFTLLSSLHYSDLDEASPIAVTPVVTTIEVTSCEPHVHSFLAALDDSASMVAIAVNSETKSSSLYRESFGCRHFVPPLFVVVHVVTSRP